MYAGKQLLPAKKMVVDVFKSHESFSWVIGRFLLVHHWVFQDNCLAKVLTPYQPRDERVYWN